MALVVKSKVRYFLDREGDLYAVQDMPPNRDNRSAVGFLFWWLFGPTQAKPECVRAQKERRLQVSQNGERIVLVDDYSSPLLKTAEIGLQSAKRRVYSDSKSTRCDRSKFVFKYSTTRCFGTCPLYSVRFRADGSIVWTGRDFTWNLGPRVSRLDDPAQLGKLEARAKSIFARLKGDCKQTGFDAPGFKFQYCAPDNKTYRFMFNNCSPDPNDPVLKDLFQLQDDLLKLANVDQWMNPPDPKKWHEEMREAQGSRGQTWRVPDADSPTRWIPGIDANLQLELVERRRRVTITGSGRVSAWNFDWRARDQDFRGSLLGDQINEEDLRNIVLALRRVPSSASGESSENRVVLVAGTTKQVWPAKSVKPVVVAILKLIQQVQGSQENLG